MNKKKNGLEWLVIIALITLPIFIGFVYIFKYGVNVPFQDEWFIQTAILKKFFEGGLSFVDFFAQHNESKPFFPRIILLIVDVITRYNTVAEMFLAYIIYCLSFLTIFLMYKKDNEINKISLLVFVPLSWFFFNLYQMGNMLLGVHVIQSLMLLGFVSAVYFIDSSTDLDKRFAISLVAAIISSFSFVAGLTTWPACLVQLILQKSECKIQRIAIWIVTAGFTFGAYLYGYQKPFLWDGITGRYLTYSPLEFLHSPFQAVLVFLSSLGLPIMSDLVLSPISGILLLIISIFAIFNCWLLNDNISIDKNLKWFSLVLFSIITSVEIVLGRTGMGLENAISLRYYWEVFLIVIGLYCILLNLVKASSPGQNTIEFIKKTYAKNPGLNLNQDTERKAVMSCVNYALVGVLVVLLFIGIVAQSEEGFKNGPAIKEWKYDLVYYLKNYENQPDKNLRSLCESTWQLGNMAQFLKKHNLSVFAEKDEIDINKMKELKTSTLCSIDLINNQPPLLQNNTPFIINGDEILIEGWAVDIQGRRPAKAVFITIDGKMNMPVRYGIEREDLATGYQIEGYKNSGFMASFTSSILTEGSHSLVVKVVSDGKKGYYKPNSKIMFTVKGPRFTSLNRLNLSA